MKTTTFNLKRFNLLVKKDLIFNSTFYLLQLLVTFMIIVIIGYMCFFEFESAPSNKIMGYRFQVLIPTYIIFMTLFSFNIFKFYTSKIKTQNSILNPNSQIEKICCGFLKIALALLIYPLLFILAFKLGFIFKSFDWEITNNSPSISSLFNTNNNDNEFIKRAVKLVYTALFINLIYVLGNLTFRKYRLVKTSIVLATLFVIIFLITLLFKKYEIKYSNTQSNILSSPYLLIVYLIILKTLIYLRFKKIQA